MRLDSKYGWLYVSNCVSYKSTIPIYQPMLAINAIQSILLSIHVSNDISNVLTSYLKKRLPIKIQRYITIFSSMLLVNPTRVMVKAWLIVFQVIHPLVWFLTSKIYPHKNGFMTIPSNIPQLLILIGFISHYTMKSPCELLNISKSDYWPTWV